MCCQLPNSVLQFNQLQKKKLWILLQQVKTSISLLTYNLPPNKLPNKLAHLQFATSSKKIAISAASEKQYVFVLVCEKHSWGQDGVQNFLSHIRMWQNDNAQIWLKSHLGVPRWMRKMVWLFRSCVAAWSNLSKFYSHLDFVVQWELELWFPTRMQISFPYCGVGYFLNESRFSMNGHTEHGQAMLLWGVLFCK